MSTTTHTHVKTNTETNNADISMTSTRIPKQPPQLMNSTSTTMNTNVSTVSTSTSTSNVTSPQNNRLAPILMEDPRGLNELHHYPENMIDHIPTGDADSDSDQEHDDYFEGELRITEYYDASGLTTGVVPIEPNTDYEEGIKNEKKVYKDQKSELRRSKSSKRSKPRTNKEAIMKESNLKLLSKEREFLPTFCMMLGIRTMVSMVESKKFRKIEPLNFRTSNKLRFPREGTTQTPAHNATSFRFKDYMPEVFRHIRAYFNLSPLDYITSVCGNYLFINFISNSKSGQFFFYSHDRRFMIKTITYGESKFLRKIMPQYYDHVMKYPNTLLSRFFGMHRVRFMGQREKHFLVMGSVFYTRRPMDIVYDLKGSVQGRSVTQEERDNPGGCVFKDNDFLIAKEKINIGQEMSKKLTEQLEIDIEFLRSLGIMDYSLLVGVHDMELEEDNDGEGDNDLGFDTIAAQSNELHTNPHDNNIHNETLGKLSGLHSIEDHSNDFMPHPKNGNISANISMADSRGDGLQRSQSARYTNNNSKRRSTFIHVPTGYASGKSIHDTINNSGDFFAVSHDMSKSTYTGPKLNIHGPSGKDDGLSYRDTREGRENFRPRPSSARTSLRTRTDKSENNSTQLQLGTRTSHTAFANISPVKNTQQNSGNTSTPPHNSSHPSNASHIMSKDSSDLNDKLYQSTSPSVSSTPQKTLNDTFQSEYNHRNGPNIIYDEESRDVELMDIPPFTKQFAATGSTEFVTAEGIVTNTNNDEISTLGPMVTTVGNNSLTSSPSYSADDKNMTIHGNHSVTVNTTTHLDESTRNGNDNDNDHHGDRGHSYADTGVQSTTSGVSTKDNRAVIDGVTITFPQEVYTVVQTSDAANSKEETLYGVQSEFMRHDGGILGVRNNHRVLYYVGVIDILTVYNWKKRGECWLKSLKWDKNEISSVSPKRYARRFMDYMKDSLE